MKPGEAEQHPLIARVITDLSLDKVFDYIIPPDLEQVTFIGSRAEIPFGHSTRIGFILNLSRETDVPRNRLKSVSRIVDEKPLLPEKLLDLGHWLARYYCCSIEKAVKCLLPGVIRGGKVRKKQLYFLSLAPGLDVDHEVELLEKKAPKQAMVLKKLSQRKETAATVVRHEFNVSDAVVNGLVGRGFVIKEKREVARDPFANDKRVKTDDLTLTGEQLNALEVIIEAVEAPKSQVVLLDGVTGSGKTEVYIQAIRRCLEHGLQAIVLVPEIALTPQTVERFKSRFGDQVSVLHSGLSDGERFDEWMKVHEGKVNIVVGARSALFAPFRKLGLIIVDEEHENTYKQGEAPRYHARDVAVLRGHLEKAAVVLGSATPSFESFYNVQAGKYAEVRLTERIEKIRMPEVRIVDLKQEKVATNQFSVISRPLKNAIYKALEQGEQTILFLNRRGYATSMQCLKCGFTAECPACERPYTYHKLYGQLICHYCNSIFRSHSRCPQCGDPDISISGLGTERIEVLVQKIFPKARVARMDSDTMGSARDYEKTLNAFSTQQIDILIGTQMIAKGLHFPQVTVVGILMADMGLNIPDFRASERTLQLLTQVAGRAGRGQLQGTVYIQTFSAGHPALQAAVTHDYRGFYQQEISSRKLFSLPPFSHMILIHFRGENMDQVIATAQAFHDSLKPVLAPDDQLSPPIPSPIEKVRSNFRYQLSIYTSSILRVAGILRRATVSGNYRPANVRVSIDIDPYSLL